MHICFAGLWTKGRSSFHKVHPLKDAVEVGHLTEVQVVAGIDGSKVGSG